MTVASCWMSSSPVGNLYMDSRQNMSSMMGPPGYPHMSNAGSTVTGTTANYSDPLVVCVCACMRPAALHVYLHSQGTMTR